MHLNGRLRGIMSAGLTDSELIHRIIGGETAYYAELVKRYQNFVFTIAMRYTENREDAEEIAQDSFVKAFKNLSDFRGESRFSTWLYTIATTTSLSFLRKKKQKVHSLDVEQVFEAADQQQSHFQAYSVENKSKIQMVNQAIALLSADDANLISLFYKGEQSLEEIGTILGIDPNTVKVKLHRARTRLREKMQTHFKEEVANLKN